MSLVTRDALASPDASTAQFAPQITGLVAGEALDPAAPCYIKASDGKVYMSNATGVGEPSHIAGFSARSANAGEAVTLYGYGTRFHYGSGLTPGAKLYIGTTKGRLDDSPTTGDWYGVAEVVSATDIRIIRSHALSVAWYS